MPFRHTRQTIPIHRALTSPILLAGAERELTIGVSFLSAIIWVAGKDIISVCMALVEWMGGNAITRSLAKHDPELSKTYLRHIRYQAFYSATEKLGAPTHISPSFRR